MRKRKLGFTFSVTSGLAALALLACGNGSSKQGEAATASPLAQPATGNGQSATSPDSRGLDSGRADALPAEKTGGFDGARAYDYTAKLVSFGPRPPDSDAIHRTQDYIKSELKADGCTFDEDDFHSSTPIGDVPMKNIIVKIPGQTQEIILLLTHYDTLKKDGFVGAVDGGSSTGLMLEMARELCPKKQPLGVWIAFLDGEEAFVQWSDEDSVYGSRELAARMALSGELKRIKAVILADMVGPKNLEIRREPTSTGWLTNLVWQKAAALGYGDVFVSKDLAVQDDHLPFLRRQVAAVDIIDLAGYQAAGYWHTNDDTMDKVSARSLGIVGHVILATMDDLQGHKMQPDKGKTP
ncbi:MAG: M28 family peptidase [Candidatus Acidiferrales bacterium]